MRTCLNSHQAEWEEKVWGRVLHCFYGSTASVSYLETKAGFQCSKHYHLHRNNTFIVISGKILIEVWPYHILGMSSSVSDTSSVSGILSEGDIYKVPSKVVHRFSVLESGQVIEVYDCPPTLRITKEQMAWDIYRYNQGGPIEGDCDV